MENRVKTFISSNKEKLDNVMDVLEQGAEVVASFGGDFFPIFAIAAPVVKLALDNVESQEVVYMKKQFQKVRDRLEVASEEIQKINIEIKKSGLDVCYFQAEENISNQFRKYMDILSQPRVKPKSNAQFQKSREVKKTLFLEHFAKTGGEKNLINLYDGVTGNSSFREPLLDVILEHMEKSRRHLEEYCAMLKKLFCVGLIALLGHAALKGYDEEEALLEEWGQKMKVVQQKMNAVIEDCIASFPKQAEEDSRRIVRDQSDLKTQQLADAILDKLKKKYDWVGWSVRVFASPTGWFSRKKDYHCSVGKSLFHVSSSDEKLNVCVSYSSSPEPLDKGQIQQLLQSQKKLVVVAAAELLFKKLPGDWVVHTVKSKRKPVCSWGFSEELHYWEEHKNIYVCVHAA